MQLRGYFGGLESCSQESVGEHLSYRCLFTQSWKSSHPKGPEFIIWSFCFGSGPNKGSGSRPSAGHVHVSCFSVGIRAENRIKSTKDQRNPGDWRLFPGTIHIRFSRVTSTTGSSECLTLLAVTEIGAEPKYRHFETHSLRGILLSPTAFLHHLGLSGDLSKVSLFFLFLARTLEIKVNWVFLFLPLFKG